MRPIHHPKHTLLIPTMISNLVGTFLVDEIVIDANLVLQWPHGMSLDPQVDDDGLDALGGIMYMPSV